MIVTRAFHLSTMLMYQEFGSGIGSSQVLRQKGGSPTLCPAKRTASL